MTQVHVATADSEGKRPPRHAAREDALVAVALAVTLLVAYTIHEGTFLGNDTRPAVFTAVSLAKRGDFDLEEFRWALQGNRKDLPYYVLPTRSGGMVSRLGMGGPLAAVPVFAPVLAIRKKIPEPDAMALGRLVGAIYVAAAAALLFLTARRFGAGARTALVLAVLYGVGTCAFSVASQALWQHGPAQFFLTLGLYLLAREGGMASAAGAGAAFAAAVVCRPPDAFFALGATAFVLLGRRKDGKRVVAFALGALPLAVAQLAYNWTSFGGPLVFGQTLKVQGADALPHEDYWRNPIIAGIAGLLVSPSRGLFVYTPAFLFLLVRPVESFRAMPLVLRFMLGATIALTAVLARYYGWYGGWCFGYRMLADASPFLTLALLPALGAIGRLGRPVFVGAVAASIAIHAAGAYNYSPFDWDARPDLDRHPDRLWSWSDGQLRYVFTHRKRHVPL